MEGVGDGFENHGRMLEEILGKLELKYYSHLCIMLN
jgi:hypothetical protein